jgi:type I restriction enzyme S subunit
MSFPRYEAYKDSEVDWLGEVPRHWQVSPLRHLVSIASGGTPSKDNPGYWNGDLPWASAKDLKQDVLEDTQDHICEQAIRDGASSLEPAGSVLVLVRGMMLARAFPVVLTRVPMAINQDHKALRGIPGVQNEFLAWQLRGAERESLGRVDEAGHGTKALRMEAWTSLPLCVPPGHEQRAIVSFLDRETAKIDALVEEQQRLIALLREKRQAIISHAVTKGLDPNAPMKDSGVEWLGQVPEHWEARKVRAISSLKGRLGWQGLKADEYRDDGPYVVSSAHFDDYHVQWDKCPRVSQERYNTDNNIQLSVNDLLLMKDGAAMGKLAFVESLPGPACLNSHLLLFRPLTIDGTNSYGPKFMFYFMQTGYFQEHIKVNGTGATFLGV